jgi:hypothetical protein
MSNANESDGYQVYLLRLWRAQCKGQWEWRASIESPGSGERQSFASLEQLSAYLREQWERQVPDPTQLPGAGHGRGIVAPEA